MPQRFNPWQREVRLLAMACAMLLQLPMAQAATKPMPWESTAPPNTIEDRLRLDVGVWQQSINTSIRSDATAQQPGTELDGERDVGLSDSAHMLALELTVLPGKRQLFRVAGFSSRRSGDAILTRSVNYDGNLYTVGSRVQSLLNIDMLGVGYAYRLFKHPKFSLALGADIDIASVDSNVNVVGQPRQGDSGVLPIPMLDGELRWEVWRRLEFMGRYRWLGGSGNNGQVKGALRDWRAGLAWQFNPHWNVGMFQRRFSLDVDAHSGAHPGALKLEYSGWEFAVRASL